MTTFSTPFALLAALGLCAVTGCTPIGGGTQGTTKQQLTASVTHGTNVNQSFTLGAQSTQASPLAFDWTCTNAYENCDFTLTATTDDIEGDVAAWAASNPSIVNQPFQLEVGVLMMMVQEDGMNANILNPEIDASFYGASTPGTVDCQYGTAWSCTTNTTPQVASASVAPNSWVTMEVVYQPVANYTGGAYGPVDIDVSQLNVAVDITTALAWQ